MADYSDNDLRYYADRLDAVLHQFTGMGAGTTSSTGTGTFGRNKTAFHKSMDKATEGLEFMHGSAMDASHALRNFLGMSAISGIVTAVVHSMTDMYSTFSKLTDVGFNFGGSMLEMQKQAGDSGLSLDEFARSLGRSSTVVAQMGDAQTQGTKQFADYQKVVRDSLKEFGYYGMTLSQVDDASGDYLDNLRRAGQLTGLTTKQEAGASQEFIANVNAMAQATGKSREEIMKLTSQALHDPAAAARLSELGLEATKSFMNTAAVLSASMGQAGVDISHMFAQTIGNKGRTWATEMGDAAIKVGLPGFNSLMGQMADATTSGQPITRDLFDQLGQMRDLVQSHVDSLLDLQLNPQSAAGATKMLAWLEEMQGYDPARAFARSQQAQKDHDDGVTQAAAMFETNLHDMTGSFRSGLYKGILDMIAPGKDVKEQIKAFSSTVDTIKDLLKNVGTAVGKVFGLLIDAVTPVTWVFKQLVSVLGGVQMAIEGMLKPFGLGQGAGTPVWEQEDGKDKLDDQGQRIPVWEKDEDGKDIVGKQATTEATNYAKIFSSTITVAIAGLAALWVKRRISSKLHMAARDVFLTARGIFGPKGQPMFGGGEGPHGGGGGVGGLGDGMGGAKAAAPKGRLARLRSRLSGGGGGGGFLRGALGFAAGELISGMINELPDFTGKDTIEEMVPWASFALNAFAPQFVSSILARIAGLFVKSASAAGGLLSRMSGFIKTGFTSFMGMFNKIPIPRMPFGAGLLGRLSAAVTGGFRSIVTGISSVFTRTFSGIGKSMTGMFRSGGGLLKGIGGVFTRMFSGIGSSIAGIFRGSSILKMGGSLLAGGAKFVAKGLIGGLVSLLIDPFLNLFGNFTGKATLSSMATYAGIGASIGSLFVGVGAIPGAIVGGIIGIIIENFNALIGSIGSILKESWVGASAWVKSFFDGIIDWFHDQLFGEDPAKQIKDAKKEVAGGKSWWRYILGLDDAKPAAAAAAKKAGAMGPNPIDGKAMERMYAQLPEMLAAGMRIDPLGSNGGADRYDAFAKAIVDVQNDTAKTYLTPPVPTDTFETLNQRLLDTTALIAIDQEKNAKAPDPKLDIEIQKAQLEQLQLQNALIARGNTLQQDANRVSPWQ